MHSNTTRREQVIAHRVRDGLSLVQSIATKVALLHPIDTREAAAFGNVGLLDAARSFRARGGVPFRAWAAIRIRGAILDGVRRTSDLPAALYSGRGGAKAKAGRLSRHLAGMVTASESGIVSTGHDAGDARMPSPEQALLDAEEQLTLRRAVARLAPVERSIIEKHYFLGETLADASGKSRSRGSRLHAQVLQRLRRELARADGESSARQWRVAC